MEMDDDFIRVLDMLLRDAERETSPYSILRKAEQKIAVDPVKAAEGSMENINRWEWEYD